MSEAVVEPDQDGRVILVVENHGPQPVDLEENCVLRCLQSVERIVLRKKFQSNVNRCNLLSVTE